MNLWKPSLPMLMSDYNHFMNIFSYGPKIPQISYDQSVSILKSMRSSVKKKISITSNHYICVGQAALDLFHLLLSLLIDNINKSINIK